MDSQGAEWNTGAEDVSMMVLCGGLSNYSTVPGKYSKSQGQPDYAVHGGSNSQYNLYQTQPSSAPAPQSLVPAGYPPTTIGGYGNNYPTSINPPTVAPCAPKQDEKGVDAVLDINAGNNTNEKGQQKAGNIKFGNSVKGNLPQNGRWVFNTGKNVNNGDIQESGNVEFANDYP